MENINLILSKNIQSCRKKIGITQEQLAESIGVSFQAVSKWETVKSAPDISLLPLLADVFNCSIDELFSRKIERVVSEEGNIIIYGNVENGCVCVGGSITINGNLTGDCTSEMDIRVRGNVMGDCVANGNVWVGAWINGECTEGGNTESEIETK